MPTTDPTRPPGGAPDPRLVALATRLRALRVELDRTDDVVQLLDRDVRVEFARVTTAIRGHLDLLEADVERRAAQR